MKINKTLAHVEATAISSIMEQVLAHCDASFTPQQVTAVLESNKDNFKAWTDAQGAWDHYVAVALQVPASEWLGDNVIATPNTILDVMNQWGFEMTLDSLNDYGYNPLGEWVDEPFNVEAYIENTNKRIYGQL